MLVTTGQDDYLYWMDIAPKLRSRHQEHRSMIPVTFDGELLDVLSVQRWRKRLVDPVTGGNSPGTPSRWQPGQGNRRPNTSEEAADPAPPIDLTDGAPTSPGPSLVKRVWSIVVGAAAVAGILALGFAIAMAITDNSSTEPPASPNTESTTTTEAE
jgi:hypothetical protein